MAAFLLLGCEAFARRLLSGGEDLGTFKLERVRISITFSHPVDTCEEYVKPYVPHDLRSSPNLSSTKIDGRVRINLIVLLFILSREVHVLHILTGPDSMAA